MKIISVLALLFVAGLADGPPRFEVVTAGRDAVAPGVVTTLGPGWSASVGDHAITAGQLVELHQVGTARPALPWDRPHVLFADGDRWPGAVAEIRNERVRFIPEFGVKQEVVIPLSALVVVWLGEPRPGDDPDPTDLGLAALQRTQDLVRLLNRDTLRGTLVSVDRAAVALDDAGKPVTAPRERVVAIALNTELAKAPRSRGPLARVVLATGVRLTLTEATIQDGRLVGKTVFGASVRALLGDVVALTITGGPAVELSELKPLRSEQVPYLGVAWPAAANRSTAGGPLRLGADTFDRGLGLHSQSHVTYAVPAGASRFEAWVGQDAVAGRLGRSRASVLVGGKARFGPADLTGEQPPGRVTIDLPAGAKELTLAVDFGPAGDVQGHVDWAEARFIVPRRTTAEPGRAGGVQ